MRREMLSTRLITGVDATGDVWVTWLTELRDSHRVFGPDYYFRQRYWTINTVWIFTEM